MDIKETIGIDVSKLTFDVTIHSTQVHSKFDNEPKGFKSMLKWIKKNTDFVSQNTIYVFEHTGLYSYRLASFLTDKNLPFAMIPGLEIKRSLGITRGKDDKVDSRGIARYGYRLRDEIKPTTLPSDDLRTLKSLLTLRDRKVRQRAGDKAALKEYTGTYEKKGNEALFDALETSIKDVSALIDKIEKELMDVLKNNSQLEEQYHLLTSIKGVGDQTALYTIVYTEGYLKFETSRQFASYCGVAPFPNSSGTSLRGKTKVSNLANKKIKSLLDQGAKSALQHNPEIRTYYKRRLESGKCEMSTINIIRNKLIARMFAVIKRGTPYVETMNYAS